MVSVKLVTQNSIDDVNIGLDIGMVLSGNKPLPELMLTQIYGITRPQWVKFPKPCRKQQHCLNIIKFIFLFCFFMIKLHVLNCTVQVQQFLLNIFFWIFAPLNISAPVYFILFSVSYSERYWHRERPCFKRTTTKCIRVPSSSSIVLPWIVIPPQYKDVVLPV